MTTTTFRPASPKQVALIERLAIEKDTPVAGRDLREARNIERMMDVLGGKDVSVREASDVIDWMFSLPNQATEQAAPAKPGYYVQQGQVVAVVENRAKTSTYAKVLTITTDVDGDFRARWEYAPGLGRTLAGFEPLTVEEAARLGHLHGICVVCAKQLTDPASVERGIGPVCAKRLHRH